MYAPQRLCMGWRRGEFKQISIRQMFTCVYKSKKLEKKISVVDISGKLENTNLKIHQILEETKI